MGFGQSVVTSRSVKSESRFATELTASVKTDLTDPVRGRGATPPPALRDIDDPGASDQRPWTNVRALSILDDHWRTALLCGVVIVLKCGVVHSDRPEPI